MKFWEFLSLAYLSKESLEEILVPESILKDSFVIAQEEKKPGRKSDKNTSSSFVNHSE